MVPHWSQTYSCRCGKTFRSYGAEAVHRHNFPILCNRPKAVLVRNPPRVLVYAMLDCKSGNYTLQRSDGKVCYISSFARICQLEEQKRLFLI